MWFRSQHRIALNRKKPPRSEAASFLVGSNTNYRNDSVSGLYLRKAARMSGRPFPEQTYGRLDYSVASAAFASSFEGAVRNRAAARMSSHE